MKPAGQRRSLPNGRRLAGQDEKGGLKGVVRVGVAAQNIPADIEHEFAMTPHDDRKRRFIAPLSQPPHQVGIGQVFQALGNERGSQLAKNNFHADRGHGAPYLEKNE